MLGQLSLATSRLGRGLAFTAGLSFAALPAFGPFLAILAIATGRIELQRADRWWWWTSLLLGAPLLVTGSARDGLLVIAQVLAVWLIFRASAEARKSAVGSALAPYVAAGLVLGLAVMLVTGFSRIDGFTWKTSLTALDAIEWQANPAVFGHSILVLSSLLAVIVPSSRLRVLALAIGALGVLLSGAREAAFAWLLVAFGLRLMRRRGSRGTRIAEWTLVAAMAIVVSGLGAALGLGRTGFLTSVVAHSAGPNLYRGTEVAVADWWHALGVRVSAGPVEIDGKTRTGFTLTKASPEPWSRLQQFVTLQPGTTYTISAAWNAPEGIRPGLDGWGRSNLDDVATVLTSTRDGQALATTTGGTVQVVRSAIEPIADRWERATVTFRYVGEQPLVWYTGVVADRSVRTGGQTTFAELQLTATDGWVPYVPGVAERGVTDLRASRFPIWSDAVEAFLARPWFGWGSGGLPEAVETLRPEDLQVRPLASHAHNMLLDVLVRQGIVGAIGLGLLVGLLALRTVQQRDRAMALVLAGVLVLNVFDTTLLSGEVIYALSAVLGWRAVGRREVARTETGVGSASVVRAFLAAADAASGAIAITFAIVAAATTTPATALASAWTPSLTYAIGLWPVLAYWSGLHPGYGRPAYDELARSIRAAVGATVLLGFGVLLLPDAFQLSSSVLVLTGVFSVVLSPSLRAATKLVLRAMRLWGRPVVLLGTGPDAERTARHLLRHPGIGLHPVAVFGEGKGWGIGPLPVTGDLDHTWSFLSSYNVRHAIVTPDAAAKLAFDDMLVRADRQLRYVQYLPDLRGVPTNSVAAAPIGTALGLEVRNQLASGTNRAIKRIIDVLGATVLLAVLGVPLSLVALAIRLDSRGAPFYLSPRLGRYGSTFRCVKFRTMHVDADERLQRLLDGDPALREEYGHYHKLANDPRVTRIGKLLRRGSIDELPQLVNVLKGDMSLVGPRPYLVREFDEMTKLKDLIFLARPGMTGYWQVEARNDVSFEERQVMEAHYVRNWSVWWDIEILLRTPAAVRSRTGK